eukprot:scaffold17384_cov110-Isochrysis_galbana.AAC.1
MRSLLGGTGWAAPNISDKECGWSRPAASSAHNRNRVSWTQKVGTTPSERVQPVAQDFHLSRDGDLGNCSRMAHPHFKGVYYRAASGG